MINLSPSGIRLPAPCLTASDGDIHQQTVLEDSTDKSCLETCRESEFSKCSVHQVYALHPSDSDTGYSQHSTSYFLELSLSKLTIPSILQITFRSNIIKFSCTTAVCTLETHLSLDSLFQVPNPCPRKGSGMQLHHFIDSRARFAAGST